MREDFEIHQGLPFESRCQVRVPESAMHSFHANHNEVSWKLIVKGSVVGWPDYRARVPNRRQSRDQWPTLMSARGSNFPSTGTPGFTSPGETLRRPFQRRTASSADVRAIELSVLWHTDGKGDEDMSVHYFERIELAGCDARPFASRDTSSTELPNSPLSYTGLIVKICWCVRVRVFVARGKDLTLETPFQLGTVPTPQSMAT